VVEAKALTLSATVDSTGETAREGILVWSLVRERLALQLQFRVGFAGRRCRFPGRPLAVGAIRLNRRWNASGPWPGGVGRGCGRRASGESRRAREWLKGLWEKEGKRLWLCPETYSLRRGRGIQGLRRSGSETWGEYTRILRMAGVKRVDRNRGGR
jgi:hypothetical protein